MEPTQPTTNTVPVPTPEIPQEKKGNPLLVLFLVGGIILIAAIAYLVMGQKKGSSLYPTQTQNYTQTQYQTQTPSPTPASEEVDVEGDLNSDLKGLETDLGNIK